MVGLAVDFDVDGKAKLADFDLYSDSQNSFTVLSL
jgi:hypothetical protein